MNLAQDLIFRIKADVSNSEAGMNKVIRRSDEMKISTEKAGKAIRSLASIIQSGQDPVIALSHSFENLSRAFGLGLAGTVAVVGISQVIKSFIKDTEKMNEVTRNLNTTLDSMNSNIGSLDFSGAVKQIETIRNAVDQANAKLLENDSILGKIGKTVEETFLGGARRSLEDAKAKAKQAEVNAKTQAETNLTRENELKYLEMADPLEAKRVKIMDEYNSSLKKAQDLGMGQEFQRQIEIRKNIAIGEVAQERERIAMEKAAKEKEAMNKMMESARSQRPSATTPGMAGQPSPQAQTYESLITKLNEISARVQNIYDVANERLGVPILRTAY